MVFVNPIAKTDVPVTAPGQSILVVEVRDERHGAIHYWSLNKLRARLDGMRKMYEAASEPLSPSKHSSRSISRKSSVGTDLNMSSPFGTPMRG